jgi:hypothetical protein
MKILVRDLTTQQPASQAGPFASKPCVPAAVLRMFPCSPVQSTGCSVHLTSCTPTDLLHILAHCQSYLQPA